MDNQNNSPKAKKHGSAPLLKAHSPEAVEKCIAEALSKLTGDRVEVTLNNLVFVAPTSIQGFLGERSGATFDVAVRIAKDDVDTPF